MEKISHDEYLDQLLASQEIRNPQYGQLLRLCPYLTIAQLYEATVGQNIVSIALPPVLVRGTFQLATWFRGTGGESWLNVGKNALQAESRKGYLFATEAAAYAESEWGSRLIDRYWHGTTNIVLQDPKDLSSHGYPRTKLIVYCTLSRSTAELLNVQGQPRWQVRDNSIIRMTANRFEGLELKAGGPGTNDYNCARCGMGLGLTDCPGCHAKFRDPIQSGGSDRLGPTLTAYIRSLGHEFEIAPETWYTLSEV
jgi:hypothetical protein